MKCENQGREEKHPLTARTGLLLAALCGALLLSSCGGGGGTTTDSPQVKTTNVTWDSVNQSWVETSSLALIVDGSTRSSSELKVELPADEAVKQVVVTEVQLVNSHSEPTLKIAGRDSLGADGVTILSSGDITICTLVVRKVDIEELVVENVQASRVTVVDFASEHGLDVKITPVNVIRCGRGGVGVLALGAETSENGDLLDFGIGVSQDAVRFFNTAGKEGVRMNKVEVLGPEGGDGFIETFIIDHSSVFGKVELKNLKIKELIIESVTVDH